MDVQKARYLRRNLTDAEQKLWQHIRKRQIEGCKFRRQRPIGPYIVDFVCLEKALILEVDGGQHQQQLVYDDDRKRGLEEQGYCLIRFWNNEIFENLSGVLEYIRLSLKKPSG